MKHSGKVIIAVMAMFLCTVTYAQQAVTGVVTESRGGGTARSICFR